MSYRWFFISLFGLLTAWAAVDGVVTALRAPPPNVIVLTVESTRADALSAERTPALWAAAQDGTRFTRHRAESAWTAPNVVSILTGLSPFDLGLHTRGNHIPETWDTALEDLAEAGWRVAGLQAFMAIDLYRNLGLTLDTGQDPFAWLAARALERQPFVLWHHYLDTHLPYAPPPPYRPDWRALLADGDAAGALRIAKVMTLPAIAAGSVDFQPSDAPAVKALYYGGLKEFDDWFAAFWSFLEKSGLRNNTIVVLTADHGEEHLERGLVGHASTTRDGHLYEEVVRTPLIVWLPPGLRAPPPAVIDRPSRHTDVMATLLRLLGRPVPDVLAGGDLFDLPARRPWTAVTSQGGFAEPDPARIRRYLFAYLDPPYKLHVTTEEGRVVDRRLYDLDRDPGERTDLAPTHGERAARLDAALAPRIAALRPPHSGDATGTAETAPAWVFPARSGRFGYDDLAGRFRLEWSGDPMGRYVVEYQAGEGALALNGTMNVAGRARDFGAIDRHYWETWVVPYKRVRLRVGVAGRDDLWSPWRELEVRP